MIRRVEIYVWYVDNPSPDMLTFEYTLSERKQDISVNEQNTIKTTTQN